MRHVTFRDYAAIAYARKMRIIETSANADTGASRQRGTGESPMKDYSTSDLRQIAQINEDHHLGLLTDCGIHQDFARKIIAMTDTELAAAVAKFRPIANKTAMQQGLVAAAEREIIIRGA